MLYSTGIPLVSPTISDRETLDRFPFLDSSFTKEESMDITKKVLAMAVGTTLGGDHPVLAPRPGKL